MSPAPDAIDFAQPTPHTLVMADTHRFRSATGFRNEPGTLYRAATPWETPTHFVTTRNGLGTYGFVVHPRGTDFPFELVYDTTGKVHIVLLPPPGQQNVPPGSAG